MLAVCKRRAAVPPPRVLPDRWPAGGRLRQLLPWAQEQAAHSSLHAAAALAAQQQIKQNNKKKKKNPVIAINVRQRPLLAGATVTVGGHRTRKRKAVVFTLHSSSCETSRCVSTESRLDGWMDGRAE